MLQCNPMLSQQSKKDMEDLLEIQGKISMLHNCLLNTPTVNRTRLDDAYSKALAGLQAMADILPTTKEAYGQHYR